MSLPRHKTKLINIASGLRTLENLEKQAVLITFIVFASFHIFRWYNSIITFNDIFAAVALLSLSIVNMKFCRL